jgi:cytochrome c-type biogenesis protein CcmH
MTLWFVMALMTAAAIFAVLWPLSRRAPLSAGSDVAVYRDQLDEIDRDRAAGLIGDREAEAARLEVSRRLLAAADATVSAPQPSAAWRRRAVALVALLLLPLGAAGLYLMLGSPDLPGQPQAARRDLPPEQRSIADLVGRVEAHLEGNPEDGRGWEVIGPVYMRLGRYDDAVKARRNSLRLLGPTAVREADLGEALTGAANGIVTAEARAAFDRALVLDPDDFRARYFSGLAAEQDGRPKDAAGIWTKLLAGAPEDAAWIGFVRESLLRVDPNASVPQTRPNVASPDAPKDVPGPSAADVAAAGQMSPEQRETMVRGMVARLAERLKQDGSDVDGWLRLLRAYMVLGDKEQARASAADARRALEGNADGLRRLDEAIKGLGLEG